MSRSTSSRVAWTANDARVEAGNAEPPHQRLRAVMAGAHAHALAAEDLGHVVRVRGVQRERDERAAPVGLRRAVDRQPGHLAEPLQRVRGDVTAVLAHVLHPDRSQPLDGLAEPDRLGDRHRARLEARRRLGPRGLEVADPGDHVPAAQERRHRLQDRAPAVQHADAGRPVGLVPGPDVEVGVQLGDVDRQRRHGLGAVHQDHGAGRVRAARDLRDRVDRPDDVRDVRDRDELRALLEQRVVRVEVQHAVVAHRDVGEPAAEQLPRDDVRVVLHLGEHHEVVRADVRAAPRVRDEVDRLGRVLREHRLADRRVREPRHPLARELVRVRGLRGDRVDAAVDRGAVGLVVAVHRLQRRSHGLRGGRGVEIHQALAREGRELGGRGDRQRHQAAAATSSRIQP